MFTVHWLLKRKDERWFVLSIGLNDPTKEADGTAAATLAEEARLILEAMP